MPAGQTRSGHNDRVSDSPDFPQQWSPAGAASTGLISVRGAQLHNLRDVDLDVPRDRLVAFTGVSGSGKSSLAFGTIHAEAQRRYFESVAPFVRRLIHLAVDPRVRAVSGLPPAVALGQRPAAVSRRSSVGTVTTTSNTLRMLWSRCGDYPPGLGRLDSDHFSANTAVGACPECSGLGQVHRATESSMVPDPGLSIAEKAIASWPGAWQGKNYRDIVATLGYDVHRPWRELPQASRDWILFTDDEPVVTVHPERDASRIQRPYQGTFASARRHVMRTLASASSKQRQRALKFVETAPCPLCHGRRLHPDALRVTWQGLAIDEATRLPVDELVPVLARRRIALADAGSEVADAETRLLDDLLSRLEVLIDLGLGHLDLGRPTPAVSSGELQRLRLATLLRSGLFGVVYVLDEPSAGLPARDAEPLLRLLRALVEAGNSVLVVEHDMAMVARCDVVIDVGPGAGSFGGEVLYNGQPAGLPGVPGSATGRYLFDPVHADEIRRPGTRSPRGELSVQGISLHNLRELDVRLPLGVCTVISGVSGSGKTSLITALDSAVGALLERAGDEADESVDGEAVDPETALELDAAATWTDVEISGPAAPTRLVRLTSQPIGRTIRSNLATYTGLFDHVRRRFAAEPDARALGFGPGRFSFNVAEGRRCPTCQGEGVVAVELLFLPGTSSTCPECHGARYNADTLQVRHRGRTIAEVLDLTVGQAVEMFADDPPIHRVLVALDALGLHYLSLGRPATELSGGEAQRIKLATELAKERRATTLYLFDEPTTGLHPVDAHRLLARLHDLVDHGHTVVMVDHHPAALATCDHRIELGPGAGSAGGRIVAPAQWNGALHEEV